MDYSQHGEGKIISDYFKDFKGTLISLGENDGKTLSNALGLIEKGWEAYLVEPSQTAFSKLESLHYGNDKVKCFNFAIGLENGEAIFYESGEHLGNGDTSLLSSISKEEVKRWGNTCTFKETKVKVLDWKEFIKESNISRFDFITIDCEGVDWDILKQINFNKHGTKLVCVESNNVENQKYINHMAKYGFKLLFKNQCNLIFSK